MSGLGAKNDPDALRPERVNDPALILRLTDLMINAKAVTEIGLAWTLDRSSATPCGTSKEEERSCLKPANRPGASVIQAWLSR